MDTDVQRRKAFVDDTLEICFRETSHRGEISKQETQSVVVVFHVQTAAHAFWQLINEAKFTVVVARMNTVKHSARDRYSQWLTGQSRQFQFEGLSSTYNSDVDLVSVN